MRITPTIAAVGVTAVLLVTACSNSSTSSPSTAPTKTAPAPSGDVAPTSSSAPAVTTPATSPASSTTAPTPPTTLPGAIDPNAPEVVEPGDIPDNQVFIPFAPSSGVYTVKVPEGWARTEANGVVTFTDKYNSIALASSTAAIAPTVASVKSDGLSDVASDPTFTLIAVTPVTRRAGTGVLATYEIGSVPNSVTGKKALLAVERYVFFHNGTVVTMTLSGAKGADNVDPWKIVSDSLTWK
ncbi:MAG: hypothetical protein ACXVIQ_12930 [Ilumatobacteraceae bacterium]